MTSEEAPLRGDDATSHRCQWLTSCATWDITSCKLGLAAEMQQIETPLHFCNRNETLAGPNHIPLGVSPDFNFFEFTKLLKSILGAWSFIMGLRLGMDPWRSA